MAPAATFIASEFRFAQWKTHASRSLSNDRAASSSPSNDLLSKLHFCTANLDAPVTKFPFSLSGQSTVRPHRGGHAQHSSVVQEGSVSGRASVASDLKNNSVSIPATNSIRRGAGSVRTRCRSNSSQATRLHEGDAVLQENGDEPSTLAIVDSFGCRAAGPAFRGILNAPQYLQLHEQKEARRNGSNRRICGSRLVTGRLYDEGVSPCGRTFADPELQR